MPDDTKKSEEMSVKQTVSNWRDNLRLLREKQKENRAKRLALVFIKQ